MSREKPKYEVIEGEYGSARDEELVKILSAAGTQLVELLGSAVVLELRTHPAAKLVARVEVERS